MTEQPTNNNVTRYLILAVCVVAVVGMIGLTLILVLEDHTEHAVVYAGLLTTFLATALTGVYTIAGLKKLTVTTGTVVTQTNSRMDALLEATEKLAYAAGKLAGGTEEKAAEQERKDAAKV